MRSIALHPSAEESARERLARVRRRIDEAASAAGRRSADVRLVAVTKGVAVDAALALHAAGQRDFGESRPQELARKREAFGAALGEAARDVRWHLVGHLQRNKLRRAVDGLFALHSVDRMEIVESLAEAAAERAEPLAVFVEVKLTDEPTKGGVRPVAVAPLVAKLSKRPGLALRGLMGLAPWLDDEGERRAAARRAFGELAALAETLPEDAFAGRRVELSMGMSGDLEEAIHAGSHWVRVGSALFAAEDEEAALP